MKCFSACRAVGLCLYRTKSFQRKLDSPLSFLADYLVVWRSSKLGRGGGDSSLNFRETKRAHQLSIGNKDMTACIIPCYQWLTSQHFQRPAVSMSFSHSTPKSDHTKNAGKSTSWNLELSTFLSGLDFCIAKGKGGHTNWSKQSLFFLPSPSPV